MGRVFFNTRKNIHKIDGAYTMLASDSGKTFMLSATGGTVAITLLPSYPCMPFPTILDIILVINFPLSVLYEKYDFIGFNNFFHDCLQSRYIIFY